MNREELLSAAGIPADRRAGCYVSGENMIFTPRVDGEGTLLATGEQVYREWLVKKNAPAAPSFEERLGKIEAAVAALA